jgi:hypothetical protein
VPSWTWSPTREGCRIVIQVPELVSRSITLPIGELNLEGACRFPLGFQKKYTTCPILHPKCGIHISLICFETFLVTHRISIFLTRISPFPDHLAPCIFSHNSFPMIYKSPNYSLEHWELPTWLVESRAVAGNSSTRSFYSAWTHRRVFYL